MKIPAFAFTCTNCHGETVIDFHHINFTRTYTCGECNRQFKISKKQGLSISAQLENYLGSLPHEELVFVKKQTGGSRVTRH
ncbi:hypothetical protein [Geobacter sp. DSM 9736]|uniref:hypothetical protein n=1 Tax=Geobacter sp. DSM 9736 TaxID=1277350 RepID=UPI000B513DC1|nr:hypothetical protein [Geobacter sp. DSM 9736]SNB46823.1 hypothetical protein SAMN06269301_2293 [Geobacter sp. DSM 9736]